MQRLCTCTAFVGGIKNNKKQLSSICLLLRLWSARLRLSTWYTYHMRNSYILYELSTVVYTDLYKLVKLWKMAFLSHVCFLLTCAFLPCIVIQLWNVNSNMHTFQTSVVIQFCLFRTSCVFHHEDRLYMQFVWYVFHVLCKQSSRRKDVLHSISTSFHLLDCLMLLYDIQYELGLHNQQARNEIVALYLFLFFASVLFSLPSSCSSSWSC